MRPRAATYSSGWASGGHPHYARIPSGTLIFDYCRWAIRSSMRATRGRRVRLSANGSRTGGAAMSGTLSNGSWQAGTHDFYPR
jgi:hypothetical protein